MTREFDPKKSYLTLKAHEKMIAYVGFRFPIDGKDRGREGVIKISSFNRPYGGGQLTLTFIIDTEGDEALRHRLDDLFKRISDASVRSKLGNSFEKVVKVSLDALADIHSWYVEEVSIHDFEKIEWWPENLAQRPLSRKEIDEHPSVKQLFKRWFSLR
jgi:hypothetical protein